MFLTELVSSSDITSISLMDILGSDSSRSHRVGDSDAAHAPPKALTRLTHQDTHLSASFLHFVKDFFSKKYLKDPSASN